MRKVFLKELEELKAEIVYMSSLCEEAFDLLLLAFKGEEKTAEKIKELEIRIDRKEQKITNLAIRILLEENPMAGDLRRVSAAIKIVGDLERIGDQIEDSSKIWEKLGGIEDLQGIDLLEMAQACRDFLKLTVDAFALKDQELIELGKNRDDVIDTFFIQNREKIVQLIQEKELSGRIAADLLMLVKYLERVGDHCTNIIHWVDYILTGDFD